MTKAQLERISRSFTGHVITNPKVRKALHDAVSKTHTRGTPEARIARIINAAVGKTPAVEPKHVPIIAQRVNALLGTTAKPRLFEGSQINTRTGKEILDL